MVKVQRSVPTARIAGTNRTVMWPKIYKPNHAPLRYSQGYWAWRHLTQEIYKARGISGGNYTSKRK